MTEIMSAQIVRRVAGDSNIFDLSLARRLRAQPVKIHAQLVERFVDDFGIGRIRFTEAGRAHYEPLFRSAGFKFVDEPEYNDFVLDLFMMGKAAERND